MKFRALLNLGMVNCFAITSYPILPAPPCLEKVLHLGKPQDRTFRSPLSSLVFHSPIQQRQIQSRDNS
jgi:hypothetical protein